MQDRVHRAPEFPERIVVGLPPYRTAYEARPDQLLVRFAEEVEAGRASEVLGRHGLRPRRAREGSRVAENLAAAGLRWVETAQRGEPPLEVARRLAREADEVTMAAPVYYAAGQGEESAAVPLPDVVVVRFAASARRGENGLPLARMEELGLDHDETMSRLLAPFDYFHVRDPARGDAIDLLPVVQGLPGVELAELDWLKLDTYQLVPTDTFWASQWNMAQIGTVNAWDVSTGSAGVWLAIIDSGFDLGHPDLTFTPNSGGTLTHFNADQALAAMAPPYDAGPSGVPHGTSVAGLAAARINVGGVAGVAGGCSVMPVRLGTVPSAARVAAGLNWAAANGARVASLSLSTTATAAAVTAVGNAWAAGLVICAATGNSGGDAASPPVSFPASHADVIAVGASDQADQRKRPASADGECWGSQFGAETDVVAPGVRCWSTDEQGAAGYNTTGGGAVTWACVPYASSGDAAGDYIAIFDGTSAATPHVAGLAGLLFSAYPSLTNQQVRDIIERTCDKVSPALYAYAHTAGRPNGKWHQEVGYGRINCDRALHHADLMISDHAGDTGAVPSTTLVGGVWTPAPFWAYQPYVTPSSSPSALPPGQPAEEGQDNFVHALVRNNGPAAAQNVTVSWHLMDYPGTELIYPADWNPGNRIATALVASIPAGTEVVVEAMWPQASVDTGAGFVHPCMTVQATTSQDVGGDLGPHVWEHNNIAQHNISYVNFLAGGAPEGGFALPFAAGSRHGRSRRAELRFDTRQLNGARAFVSLSPPPENRMVARMLRDNTAAGGGIANPGCLVGIVEALLRLLGVPARGPGEPPGRGQVAVTGGSWTRFAGQEVVALDGAAPALDVPLEPGRVLPLALVVAPPPDARVGDVFLVHVTQVSDGSPTGGVSLQVTARA